MNSLLKRSYRKNTLTVGIVRKKSPHPRSKFRVAHQRKWLNYLSNRVLIQNQ